ncbi:MAG: hypothetical protein ACR5LG_10000 [Sodalis sp. (in: enterobacteria)]
MRCYSRELDVGPLRVTGAFHFSVSPYGTQQLTAARHWHQLRPEAGPLSQPGYRAYERRRGRFVESKRSSGLPAGCRALPLFLALAVKLRGFAPLYPPSDTDLAW